MYMGRIIKLSKMYCAIIDGKIIFQTINLKIWPWEHVPLKRYSRNKMGKCITVRENFFIFFSFLRREIVQAGNFCRPVEDGKMHIEDFLTKKCKVWGVQNAPLRRYKRLKNKIYTGGNRRFFSILEFFTLLMVIFRKIFIYSDRTG